MKTAVCYCIHDDLYYLKESIASAAEVGDLFCFISKVAWHGEPGDWQSAQAIAEGSGATVIPGEWRSELEHRQAALRHLREAVYTHALIPDGDEFIETTLLRSLQKIAESELADRVYVHWDTYWKSAEYVIRVRRSGRSPTAQVLPLADYLVVDL